MKAIALAAILLAGTAPLSTRWLKSQPATQSQAPASTPAAAGQTDSQLGVNGPVRAEDVYKNIKTLKGKPATTVLLAMNGIRGSLGVSCTYCHTQYEWERNDKPAKEKTRTMFKMLGYIEGTYFDHKNKVTCWTCHRGHPE